MSDDTPHLKLPFLAESQQNKSLTVNDALNRLDALVQIAVKDRDLAAPPATPAEGDRYIVAAGGSGVWSGCDGRLAAFFDGAWTCFAPDDGWAVWIADERALAVFCDGAWHDWSASLGALQNLALLGVGTTADAANPFSAKLNTALWTARAAGEGGTGDLRYVFNKEAAANTASLLLQDGYSGRAEIGLTGDDSLHLKVSADGGTWTEALVIDPASGAVQGQRGTAAMPSRSYDGDGDTGTFSPAANEWAVATGGTEKLRVDAAGKLSVGGNIEAGGIVFANAGLKVGAAQVQSLYADGVGNSVISAGLSAVTAYFAFYTDGTFRPLGGGIVSSGDILPASDNAVAVGSGAARWSTVYAATGTINTSDARDKTDVADSPLGLAFIEALRPVSYKWKIGGVDITAAATPEKAAVTAARAGVRTHYGLLAQDVKAALDAADVGDFAGWTLDDPADPESRQGLRYDEFIAPLIRAVQELSARVEALEAVPEAPRH
jgi:hypothetical protein